MLQVKVVKPGEGKCIWAAGDHYFFKNTGDDTGGTYSLFEGLVPPQGGPPPHFHQREYEAFYVLEGELTYHANGASTVAGPGTFVHIPKNLLHTFKNESQRDARMLAIVAPSGMEHFLEEIGRPVYDRTSTPVPMTPADVEKILAIAPKYGIGIVLPDHVTATPPELGLRVKIVMPGEGKCVWAAGDHYFFKNTGADTGGTYSLFEGLVPPGGGPPPHFHEREFEAFYILEGELTFHANGASTIAGPGTFVHIPKNLLHTFKNESNRDARMLAIVAPAGMEDFLEEIGRPVYDRSSTPVPMTPADVEKILAIAPKYGIGIVLPDRAPVLPAKAGVGDYAVRDAEGRVAFYVLLWKRKGITLEKFDDYWRDVHGPVCARLPGQYQYWQFHVAHNEGGVFPAVEGVSYSTTEADQFDGIAELTFRSVADRQTWFDAAGILMDDEHNIFSKAIGYVTEQGLSKTYVDGIATGDPNGDAGLIKFHVLVRQAPGVSTGEFRRYMTDSLAANVARSAKLLKFRLHLFEPPDLSRPDAAGVVHYEAPAQQYQAAYELAFRNHLDMELFFASPEYAAAVREQARYVVQVSPFPERNAYTFVYDGRMTLAGRRGSRTAELITRLGATNQLRADIHDLVVGGIAHSAPIAGDAIRRPVVANVSGRPATVANVTERSTRTSGTNGGPAMAVNTRPAQTRMRTNFYRDLAADYSTPEPVLKHIADRLIADSGEIHSAERKDVAGGFRSLLPGADRTRKQGVVALSLRGLASRAR